jgi:hypothetical protein
LEKEIVPIKKKKNKRKEEQKENYQLLSQIPTAHKGAT